MDGLPETQNWALVSLFRERPNQKAHQGKPVWRVCRRRLQNLDCFSLDFFSTGGGGLPPYDRPLEKRSAPSVFTSENRPLGEPVLARNPKSLARYDKFWMSDFG
jgi:hypothetical protein